MTNRTIKLKLAVVLSIIVLLYFSVSLAVITLILGLLFVPPIAVFAYTIMHGIPFFLREMEALFSSGREFLLISISKECITLEPQFR